MQRAAGILFLHGKPSDGRVLLLRYAGGPNAGTWTVPGGGCEGEEDFEACARREALEETGREVNGATLTLHARRQADGVDFVTYLCLVSEEFTPALCGEHDAFEWRSVFEDGSPRSDAIANPLEIKEKLSNAAGPDLPEGVTVKRVDLFEDGREAGQYEPGGRVVHLGGRIRLAGQETRLLARPDKVLVHEIGHSFDHHLGWPSHGFDKAWLAGLLAMLEADERLGAEYYLKTNEEAFAEAYALLHGPSEALYFGVMPRLRALAALDPLIDKVRSLTNRQTA